MALFRLIPLLIMILCASNAIADSDAIFQRELEQQRKSEQARAYRRQMGAQDFAPATQVEVEEYRFDIALLPNEQRLTGVVTLDLTAKSVLREVVLDAVGLEISKAWFIDAHGVKSEVQFEKTAEQLKVLLPVSLEKGAAFSVAIAYAARGDHRDGRASEIERGLFFVNADGARSDVSPSIYTSVEPQLARTWFPCIDDPSEKAKRMLMRVTAPQSWVVVSNGRLKNFSWRGEDKTATYEWDEAFPIPTYLISLAAGHYAEIDDKWRDIPVQYYVPKELVEKARFDFGRTPEMIEYFSKLWAPYPYEKYSMASVPHYSGAMEHTTATTISDSHINGDRESEDTVAHELAHHWWGDMVTPAGWDHLWLNEGFATYSEAIFAEKFKGPDVAFEEMLWNRASYFHFDPKADHAAVDPAVHPGDKFNPSVYEKGAWILHMLRKKLGDDAFFRACNAYLKKYAYKNAVTDDLKKTFEEVAGKDLSDFFQQWVFGKGYPELSLSWLYDSATRELRVRLEEQGGLFRFPLELVVYGAGGEKQVLAVDVTAAQQTFTQVLPVGFTAPVALAVDPELKLLMKLNVERSVDEVKFWLERQTAPELWLGRLGAIDGLIPEHATEVLVRTIVGRAQDEKSAPVRAAILDYLASVRKAKNLSDDVVEAVRRIIHRWLDDPSVEVRVEAAGAAARYPSSELNEYLARRFELEPSVRVKAKLVLSLAQARHPRAFELLYGQLQKSRVNPGHRKLLQALLEGFGRLGDPRGAAILVDFVNGANPFLQTVALEGLGNLALPDTFQLIVDILRDTGKTTEFRISSARALGNFGGVAAAKALNEQLKIEKDEDVKAAIKSALERLGGQTDFRHLSVKGSPAYLQW